jgi:hypothetical protein
MVGALCDSVDPILIKRMFRYFRQSIRSPNFKVATAAIEIYLNVHFLRQFQSVLPMMLSDIEAQTEHWCENVRVIAASAVQLLLVAYPGGLQTGQREEGEGEGEEGGGINQKKESVQTKWMALFNQVGRNSERTYFLEKVKELE